MKPRAGIDPATYGLQERTRHIDGYHLYTDDTAYYCAALAEQRPILASFSEKLFDGVMQLPPAVHDVNWSGFHDWLLGRFSYAHAVDCYAYARKYCHLLFSRRLADVENLRGKRHILMALANLSKFLGVYREFKMMVEDAGVSWSSGSKSNFMSVFLDENVDVAFDYFRRIMNSDVDEDLKRLVRFLLLSGLRPIEGYMAIRFLNERREGYLDEGRMLLCHWKFPEFSRNGKRCFLTVLTKSMMDDLKQPWTISEWNHKKIRRRLHKVGLPVNLYLFRKCWATWMRMNGLEQELVSVFQGRAPKTVFEVSYFRPVLDEAVLRVRTLVEKMEQELFMVEKGVTNK